MLIMLSAYNIKSLYTHFTGILHLYFFQYISLLSYCFNKIFLKCPLNFGLKIPHFNDILKSYNY